MDGRDRRHHPRLEGEFEVDLLNLGDDPLVSPWEVIVAGKALDVSRSGMRLKVPYNVTVGSLLSTILYFKALDSICLCEVVWKRPEQGFMLYGLYIKEWSRLDPALEKNLSVMTPIEKA